MLISWSKPTPVCRSARAATRAALGVRGASSRQSTITKSLPIPCILVKREGIVALLVDEGAEWIERAAGRRRRKRRGARCRMRGRRMRSRLRLGRGGRGGGGGQRGPLARGRVGRRRVGGG